ncbi:MAG: hypothetical protein OXH69_02370 [Acidobacteria bacterium]|nr:hypothetical protein [Acidobacteriota bacterium]
MQQRPRARTVLAALGIAAACGACGDAPEAPAAGSTGTGAAASPSAAAAGQPVSGRVPVSRDGSLSVVILEPRSPIDVPAVTEPVTMDQLGMEFLPPVLLAGVGQPVRFRNSEDVMHNVRVYNIETKDTAFNISTPLGGTYEHRFEIAGTYRVACDIHPAMGASVVITGAPYAAVAGRDGRFTLDEVIPGPYTAVVQAGTARSEHAVDIRPAPTELDLTGD